MAKNVDVIACCQGLNVNQRLSIGAALNKLRLDEKLASVSFWGKIQGKERDYFIAQSIKTGTKIEKNRFFSQDNGVTFAKLPELDAFIIETAPRHRGRFSGNPSLRLREPKVGGGESEEDFEEEEEEDYDENDGEDRKVADRKLTEVERLAFVVDQIETACCVVPKGSWFITATGDIKENVAFTGLSFDDAKKLDNFVLFRPPQKERTLAKIHKAGVANSTDFLDTVAEEEPKGCWVLQSSRSGEKVTLRSLAWPGFEFVADVNGRTYQRAYFGSGELNADLAFML